MKTATKSQIDDEDKFVNLVYRYVILSVGGFAQHLAEHPTLTKLWSQKDVLYLGKTSAGDRRAKVLPSSGVIFCVQQVLLGCLLGYWLINLSDCSLTESRKVNTEKLMA